MGKHFSYSNYPSGWHTWSRYLRETRANWCCERCGARHRQVDPVNKTRVVLTLAHLDHDHTNNNPRNLKVLCRCCHLNHDRVDNQQRIRAAWVKKAARAGHLFVGVLEH